MSDATVQVTMFQLEHRDSGSRTTAQIVPAWGCNVVAFAFRRTEWATSVPVLELVDIATVASKPGSYGIPILAPTAGRVGTNQSGVFSYRGKTYRIQPSRHGFVRDRAWSNETLSVDSITCTLDVDLCAEAGLPVDAFPFRLRFLHTLTIERAALTSCITVTNTADYPQPLSVGWHPYLRRSRHCVVRIPARSQWCLDQAPEPTPTGELLPVEGRNDFRSGRQLDAAEHWDDVFTGLELESENTLDCWTEGREEIVMKDGHRAVMNVRRHVEIPACLAGSEHRPIRHVQLYTPPGRNAICLEPLSAPPNAVNLAARNNAHADLCELAPTAQALFEMRIRMEANALDSGAAE